MTSADEPKSPGSAHRRWRLAARCVALIAAVALTWPLHTRWSTSVIVPSLSPFVAICSWLATRTIDVLALLSLPILLLGLIFPRWFCRYACPTGFLQDIVERLRLRASKPWSRTPRIGYWLLAATVGGACLGYPLFLWLDPLAIFSAFLNASHQPLVAAGVLAGVGLPVLLLLALVLPRLWCSRICPLGATQDLLACPRRLLRANRPADADSAAVESVAEMPDPPCAHRPVFARRLLLAGCAGIAGALAAKALKGGPPPPLRPPGSLDEDCFTGVCTRCGNCIHACPSRIIRPDLGAGGVKALLAPRIQFDEDYCREDCNRCGRVCPSGAIARLPLAEKRRRVIGPAKVDLDLCLLANGRECTACIRHCPYEAIAMHSPDDGFSNEPRVDLARCTGCGACEVVCPVRPLRAVRVFPQPRR